MHQPAPVPPIVVPVMIIIVRVAIVDSIIRLRINSDIPIPDQVHFCQQNFVTIRDFKPFMAVNKRSLAGIVNNIEKTDLLSYECSEYVKINTISFNAENFHANTTDIDC